MAFYVYDSRVEAMNKEEIKKIATRDKIGGIGMLI